MSHHLKNKCPVPWEKKHLQTLKKEQKLTNQLKILNAHSTKGGTLVTKVTIRAAEETVLAAKVTALAEEETACAVAAGGKVKEDLNEAIDGIERIINSGKRRMVPMVARHSSTT